MVSGTVYAQSLTIDPESSTGIALGTPGDVFVDNDGQIAEYGPAGGPFVFGAGTLSGSYGVGVDNASGDVFVADAGASTVDVFESGETPQEPTTGKASTVTGSTAMLEGTLNAGGGGTSGYYFEYNTGGSCTGGQATTPETGSTGPVHSEVTGLAPNTPYTFCLIATNEYRSSTGQGVQFTTPTVPPAIEGESFSQVGSSNATLSAQVNMQNSQGSYHYEYNTNGGEPHNTPQTAMPIGAGPVTAQTQITNLQPVTEYHFRIIVKNINNETTEGTETTFTTVPTGIQGLPDNRNYEMVTPIDKEDAEIYVPEAVENTEEEQEGYHTSGLTEAAADGNAVVYQGDPTHDGLGESSGNTNGSGYLATRSPTGGWNQVSIQAPGRRALIYQGFSSNLSVGILSSPTEILEDGEGQLPGAKAPRGYCTGAIYECSYYDIYKHVIGQEDYQPLFTATPRRTVSEFGTYVVNGGTKESCPQGATGIYGYSKSQCPAYAGGSADLNQLLFMVNEGLLEGEGRLEKEINEDVELEIANSKMYTAKSEQDNANAQRDRVKGEEEAANQEEEAANRERNAANGERESNYLYESSEGSLSLVDVLPDGKVAPNATFGTPTLSNFNVAGNPPNFSHVISTDGSRVFWTALQGKLSSEKSPAALYVRENASEPQSPLNGQDECTVTSDACSIQIDREVGGGGRFWTASSDGSKAFFTKGGLYEYEVNSITGKPGVLEDLTPDTEVQAVIGASENGDYVYYVDSAGELYLLHQSPNGWEAPVAIAMLSPEDGEHIEPFTSLSNFRGRKGKAGDWVPDMGQRTAEVTPDGQGLVFMSNQSLKAQGFPNGYQNAGRENVYVYDAAVNSLFCASCGQSGEPGSEGFLPISWHDTYIPTLLSEGGDRVFFDSGSSLVSRDTNGRLDVYEWEREGTGSCSQSDGADGGCIYLLSGGTSDFASWLLGASANGNDAFIITRVDLTPEGGDELYKVFDARVEGVKPISPPACTGTGCQGVPAPPPTFATPSSVTYNGIGNFPPSTPDGSTVKAKGKPLTRAQKLMKALKVCKSKPKKKRALCKTQAKRRYGSAGQAKGLEDGEEVMMLKRYMVALLAGCAVALLSCSPAVADAPAPGYQVFGRIAPTNLPPGGTGELFLYVYNIGAAQGSEGPTVRDVLPTGVTATGGCPASTVAGRSVVTCTLGPIEPTGRPALIEVPVSVETGISNEPQPIDEVTVSGGDAVSPASSSFPVKFGAEESGLGISNFDAWFGNPDGTVDMQAGSHPYDMTVVFSINTDFERDYSIPTGGEVHYISVDLPPGIVGDPTAVPQCTREQFAMGFGGGEDCPRGSLIGEDIAGIAGANAAHFDVYNMVPPAGVAAQFAFSLSGISTFLDAQVRTGGDDGITVRSEVPQRKVDFNSATFWGVPAEHNQSGLAPVPFLTLPTSCGEPQEFRAEITGTWQDESATAHAHFFTHNQEDEPAGFTGCSRMQHFEPAVSLAPDTSFSDTPAGLTATVKMPQGLNPEGLATSGLKETTVTLPEGVDINPGQATGLVACQPSEENIGGPEAESESMDGPPSCPAASKVGTDEIATPLLANRLKGNVYILQKNPPEVELLVAASGEGVNLKLIGTVHLNEQTGQLVTTFKGTPQDPGTPDAPLTEFVLSFSGGAQAALVTPEKCGVYTSNADFTPWATPFVQDALLENSFQITSGPNGSPCQNPLPFEPVMTAGATTDQAGGYTDFSMLLQRGDGQQRVKSLSFKTPEGLLGMIAKIPVCPEGQANAGTCSAASQIGHTVVGAGPGPYPLFIPQQNAPPAPIYLTGPYKGAPFGLSIVVPLVAGPFNLGTEVVRAKIEVDPHTSQITVVTDPLPTIVKGIPADLRSINAVIDRPEFMFNPTDCNPMSFSGTATSTEGVQAALSSHFQMGSCQALKFAPNFKVSTSGKTSRANGASLTAKIVYPVGNLGFNQASSQSNIQSVKVDLPKQLPSRLTTLQKACTAAVFNANPANCPPDSIVGHARALTPVLPVPIEGPAYFVSHAGEEFPNLVIVFQGDNVTIDLVGDTFISKAGITSSTFKQVPDVPIGLFELNLPQGKYSALAANTNLCKATLKMPTAFTAQNGAVLHQTTPVSVTGCPKHKAKVKAKAKKKHKSKKGKKG